MSTDRDVTRIVRSWLEEGATQLPDRVLDNVLDRLPSTRQRRSWWPARRLIEMNTLTRFAVAAAAVAVVAVVGFNLLPRSPGFGTPVATPTPSPIATPTPMPLQELPLRAGTYTTTPFVGPDAPGVCAGQPGCTETTADDTIRFTFTVPDGWAGAPFDSIWLSSTQNSPPAGAGMIFNRGGDLYSQPCGGEPPPDIAVGPTVDDFADGLAEHPLLDVTAPVDVTLAGYSGKYVDLQVPADLSGCLQSYYPWEPGLYAQGVSQRWHLWILDVDGVRVVVEAHDYPGTPPERQAELGAIVESIQIEP